MNRILGSLLSGLAPSLLLILGGCGKQAGPQASPTASGDVLPGSVSDAMLNTDHSRATAPLAPAAHSALEKSDGLAASASDAAPDASSAADGAPADEPPALPKPSPTSAPKPKPATGPKPAAT